MALKQQHSKKWRQMTQRWVKTATATETSAKTIEKYPQWHGFDLLILRERAGFQFRLGTDYSTHPRGPLKYQALFEKLHSFLLGRNKNQTSQESSRSWAYTQARATLHTIGGGVRLVLVLFLHGWWNAFYVPKLCIPFFFLGMEGTTVKASLKGTSETCKLFMQDCWYQTAN